MYTDPKGTLTFKVGGVYEHVHCSARGKSKKF